jgi:SAM-dependent methyltransferase
VDISPSLVAHANEMVKEVQVSGVAFVVGDMREPPCAGTFDAVTVLSQSFGFFGPEDDLVVLRAIRAALRPGGRFLLDLNDPDDLELTKRYWHALDDGYMFGEVDYDPVTCVRTAWYRFIDADGRVNATSEPERIRVYSLPELRQMITAAGLTLDSVFGRFELPLTAYGHECRERRVLVGRFEP